MTVPRGVVVPAPAVDRARIAEDLVLLRELGLARVRLGVDWAWTQPRAGVWNGDAVELYTGLCRSAGDLGLVLELALLERDVPQWFATDGGFTDAKFALHWWPRWVEGCAERFGDVVGGWVPIDHPLGLANRLVPDDPRRHGEVVDTVVTAWRDAWRILRGAAPVATALGVEVVRPVDETVQAAEAARRMDQLRWGLWLDALSDGTVRIPGRADREVADLAGACDVLGLVVRHEQETLGLLHRAAEQGPDRPMAVTYLLPPGPDAPRETAVERYLVGAEEAADEVRLTVAAVSPAFDVDEGGQGILTRDRELKDSGRRFVVP